MAPLKALFLATIYSLSVASPITPRDAASVVFSGSACPQGSNSVSASGSWSGATVNFRNFVAKNPDDSTQNCEVHFQSGGASPGWQVRLSDVTLGGKASLPAGATAKYYIQTYWSDNAGNTATIEGTYPTSDTPTTVHRTVDQQVWSKCVGADGDPGILNVNFRVALTGAGGGSFVANTENLAYQWRQC